MFCFVDNRSNGVLPLFSQQVERFVMVVSRSRVAMTLATILIIRSSIPPIDCHRDDSNSSVSAPSHLSSRLTSDLKYGAFWTNRNRISFSSSGNDVYWCNRLTTRQCTCIRYSSQLQQINNVLYECYGCSTFSDLQPNHYVMEKQTLTNFNDIQIFRYLIYECFTAKMPIDPNADRQFCRYCCHIACLYVSLSVSCFSMQRNNLIFCIVSGNTMLIIIQYCNYI